MRYYFLKEEANIELVKALSKIAYELGWAVTDVFTDEHFMERQRYWDAVSFFIDEEYGQTMCFALERYVKADAEKVDIFFALEYICKNPYFVIKEEKSKEDKEEEPKPLKVRVTKTGKVSVSRDKISLEELSKIEEQCKRSL